MRYKLFIFLLTSIFFIQLNGQSNQSKFGFEFSARATVLKQIATDEISIAPSPIGSLEDNLGAYYGSGYRFGVRYAISERLELMTGVDLQFLGLKLEGFLLTDENGATIADLTSVDQLLGVGVPLGLKYSISPRFFTKFAVAPTLITYRKTLTRTDPKDAIPGLVTTNEVLAFKENLTNLNFLIEFGLGYNFIVKPGYALFAEIGGEYYARNFFKAETVLTNRQIIGAALKVGIAF